MTTALAPFRMGLVPMPTGSQPVGPALPTAAQPMGPVLPTAQPMGPALPTVTPPEQAAAQAFQARRSQDGFESGPALPQRLPTLQAQASGEALSTPQALPAFRASQAFQGPLPAPASAPARAPASEPAPLTVQGLPTYQASALSEAQPVRKAQVEARPEREERPAVEARPERQAQPAADALPVLKAPASGEGLPQTVGAEPVNEVQEAQEQQGWIAEESAVEQKTDKDCGEASLTFVAKASRGGEEQKSEKEERQEVREKAKETRTYEHVRSRTKVNLADGASAEEVGAVLGSMGIGIEKGIGGFDGKALSKSLRQGKMVMAMVDSNAILNPALPKSKRTNEPGHLHWVTIDGHNRGRTSDPMDDYYRVRDPVHGSYWVRAKDLEGAINKGRENHGSGGLLMLEKRRGKANTPEKREALAKANLEQAAELGKGSGLGSRRLSLGESS